MQKFRQFSAQRHSLDLVDYAALHAWSVAHSADFWSALWDYTGVRAETRGERVVKNAEAMPGADWFPDARLNFADNLLRKRDDTTAMRFRSEDGSERSLSYRELAQQTAAIAQALRAEGVVAGDRVAGFLPNIPEAIVAMLATASIGAIWSSSSPDFGINGVLDRFGQIAPKVLFTADGYRYNGRVHDSLSLVSELCPNLDGLCRIVVVNYVNQDKLTGEAADIAIGFDDLLGTYPSATLVTEQLPFAHPLYILFSSGTTGKPKCIVHGAGGTLLQHLKEQQLHADVHAGDRLFFFTTCGWMMWNWLVSALASEATLLLYDGSPFYPDGNVLFDYAEAADVNQFGTSAKFIDACNKAGIQPARTHKLPNLRSVLSTGSPLVPESFDYVYKHFGKDLCLSSMSGGTDIVACFALGNPAAPVYRGELQCLALGMDVQVFDEQGKSLPVGEKGELVCVNAFPSMPVGFYNDKDGCRYHAAYFERYPNVWCHGDYVALTEYGGMVIYGRSDAVLNPGGVRIGTAEIYRQVEQFDEVVESLVIGQQWQADVRVVLFVRLREGLLLDDALTQRLQQHIRKQATPRHVPARIVQVADIPRTRSGKIVELAVRKVVHGESVDNLEALANPEALKLFADLPALAQ
jgi:acetoacetyl-CoA synthetase